jgi:hypothetical protein
VNSKLDADRAPLKRNVILPSAKMVSDSYLTRFTNYLDSQYGAECIDSLSLTKKQAAADRADYFLQARQIVVEIESLKTDIAHKMQPILAPHMGRPEFKAAALTGLNLFGCPRDMLGRVPFGKGVCQWKES